MGDFFNFFKQIGWRPGIGDPSLMGWLTVVAYLGLAFLCFASLVSMSDMLPSELVKYQTRSWRVLGFTFFALAVVKMFNLLSLPTAIGRTLAWQRGWYRNWHSVQFQTTIGLVLAGIVAILIVWNLFRHVQARNRLLILGVIILLGFVLLRATSLHTVDAVLNHRVLGIKVNWILELGVIAHIGGLTVLNLLHNTSALYQPVDDSTDF